MRKILFFSLLLLFPFLFGCSEVVVEEERVENVVRVFWHEGNRYSVMTRDSASTSIKRISFPEFICNDPSGTGIKIVADVPADTLMWVYAKIKKGALSDPSPCIVDLEIHVRSEKDLDGGGWNHGKFGSGTTTVIR